jgi:SPP1 gp7 family putative phage head morphogenesis protein
VAGMAGTRLLAMAAVLHAHAASGEPVDAEALEQDLNEALTKPAGLSNVAQTEVANAIGGGRDDVYGDAGVHATEWLTAEDERVCPVCMANEAAGPVAIGEPFPSGDLAPPAHPRCRCTHTPADFSSVPAYADRRAMEPLRHFGWPDKTLEEEARLQGKSIIKVGPKGYIHGWIYVGPASYWGGTTKNAHPVHGYARVQSVAPDKKSVHVRFDDGTEGDMAARIQTDPYAGYVEPHLESLPEPHDPSDPAPLAPDPPADLVQGYRKMTHLSDEMDQVRDKDPERYNQLDREGFDLRWKLDHEPSVSDATRRRAYLLGNNQAYRDDSARQLGITPEEYDQRATEELRRVAQRPVAIRTTNGGLQHILDQDAFKTQFEVERSRALKSNDTRSAYEETWFGYRPDMTPEYRPVYGYVQDGPERPAGIGSRDWLAPSSDHLSTFGTTQVVLKDSVKQHATMNVGDSLDNKEASMPSRMTDPQPYSFAAYDPDHTHGGINSSDALRGLNRDYSGSDFRREHFIEAQLHSPDGVRRPVTADDIDHVLFPSTPPPALRDSLAAKSIPWRVFTAAQVAKDGSPEEKANVLKVTREDSDYLAREVAEHEEAVTSYRAKGDNYTADIEAKELATVLRQQKQVDRGLKALEAKR